MRTKNYNGNGVNRFNGTRHYKSGLTLYLSFIKRDPLRLTFAATLLVVSSLTMTLPSVFIGNSINILADEGYGSTFIQEALKIIAVGIVGYVISFIAFYSFVTVAFKFERDIRQEYFDIIQSHSLTFHDENNSSELLSMGMTEISQIRFGVMPAGRMIFQNLFQLGFTLYFINGLTNSLNLNINLGFTSIDIGGNFQTIFTLIMFTLYYISAIWQGRRIVPVRTNLAKTQAKMTEESQEIFKGIEVVRSLQGTEREVEKFRDMSDKYATLAQTEGRMAAFYLPNLIVLLLTASLFTINLYAVFEGALLVGDLVVIVGMLITIEIGSLMLPRMFLLLNASLTNADRIWKKMNWQDPMPDKFITQEPEVNWDDDIEFRNVSFKYAEGLKPALSNINLQIPANSKVALIGGPGSGKTTFLNLLLQLYLPTEGAITIGGVDFTDLTPETVRKHVSRVEQEIFLFSGKVSENISFAKPDATNEMIISAASAAQAIEFIDELPDGIATRIGERGVDLSGGQRQRLAIARAILANPNILLLDDSASALDSKTEELLRRALDNLSKDRLTITVTQRLNTLVNADIIILLDKGMILDSGTHKELIARCKKYKNIFELLPKSEQILAGGIN